MTAAAMNDLICPNCGHQQEVAVDATEFTCAHCNEYVTFARCAFCQATNYVLPKWSTFKCFHCGRDSRLRAPGERLMRAGQTMENVGKTINGMVGSVILLVIIFILYQACSS